jgi:SAM-dependent methyltransferase
MNRITFSSRTTALLVATSILSVTTNLSHAQTQTPAPDVDVPFVTTAPAVTKAMLELAKVTRDDFVIDLGAGDGRIVILAAKNYGARGLGVEIDPNLVETARENASKARVSERAKFRVEDLYKTDLSVASVITMYLLPAVNLQLRQKILDLKPGTRIVSHDWDMGDWQADDERVVENLEKPVGLEKTSRVYLWKVPAKIDGTWCAHEAKTLQAAGLDVTLTLSQRYQKVNGELLAEVVSDARSESGKAIVAMPKPMRVKFRATIDGNRFAIPHPTTDAPAVINNESITLNGEAYGLASSLVFTRGAACEKRKNERGGERTAGVSLDVLR